MRSGLNQDRADRARRLHAPVDLRAQRARRQIAARTVRGRRPAGLDRDPEPEPASALPPTEPQYLRRSTGERQIEDAAEARHEGEGDDNARDHRDSADNCCRIGRMLSHSANGREPSLA